jgi:squalene-associated FAD-dependent desaturase
VTISSPSQGSTVAIAGGGLAGLAAGCALSSAGFRVTLFERRPYLGGRASSYQHPGTGEIVDNCQHVLFGCCTNLIEFYRRIGVEKNIRWSDTMTFVEPGGRTSVLKQSFLPAPLHTVPSFLSFPFLDTRDKIAIARAMAALIPIPLRDTGESFLNWLHRHGQTENAIARFWNPVLVSALSEDLDLVSVSYASQVVRESMKSETARRMGIPSIPLTDLYRSADEYIRARGGDIRFRVGVESFRAQTAEVSVVANGQEEKFDYLLLAVPFDVLARLLPDSPAAAPLAQMLSNFETSPITGIHLWFDRQITDLDHAVLLDRTIQWMFHKSKLIEARENGTGSYVELVVSSSKSLIEKSRGEIVDLAVQELGEFFPAVQDAKLVKSTVIKEVHATYSPRPGVDHYRPRPETAWPRVFLAGDFVATGWPATMEGAVRSGYLAAESLARVSGVREPKFLVPDLPGSGFMRSAS